MRLLDGRAAAPVVGLGLAALLGYGTAFPLSGRGGSAAGPAGDCARPRPRPRRPAAGPWAARGDEDEIVDAVVEGKVVGPAPEDGENASGTERTRGVFKKALQDLASLSLVDYKWRSALFKRNEADRMEEEWMARMMGEDPSYARPMDAGDETRGPLGNAEKSAVQWLMSVIEEEGQRARRIAESNGELVRPKDLSPSEGAGPLSELERRALDFLADISDKEVERVQSGTLRPKDMAVRGPLGEAEARAVLALDRVVASEKLRLERTRAQGEAVRPIDIPGPLGEFERYVADIIRAEKQRVADRAANEGRLVRPKDATYRSGLSEAERRAEEDWERLRREETERRSSLQRFLAERRPMEADAASPLGVTEAFTVGLLRGPQLLKEAFARAQKTWSGEEIAMGRDKGVLPEIPGDVKSEDESSEEKKP